MLRSIIEKPAREGGQATRKSFLPLASPSIDQDEIQAATEALESGWLTLGPRTKAFEDDFATYVQSKHAIAVSSCTAALHLSLIALDIGPGDEVITTPITFAATANVILHTGAQISFADIDPLTLNIDPEKIRKKITSKTRAIIPVHMCGRPCDLKAIQEIAEEYDIKIIEDAAHAIGSLYHGQPIGSHSEITCFSFYPTKNLASLEGGMLCTNNTHLAKHIRLLSMHGMSHSAWSRETNQDNIHYNSLAPGYKYNMTDVQAAVAHIQLKRLAEFKKRRKSIVMHYHSAFNSLKEITLPPLPSFNEDICWHIFSIQLNLPQLTIGRDDFAKALKKENIGIGFHFISLHLQTFYKNLLQIKAQALPQAYYVSQCMLSLPLCPKMTRKDTADVICALSKLIKYYRK